MTPSSQALESPAIPGRFREWADQRSTREGEGGDYYATQATYLGEAYLNLVFSQHQRGRLTTEEMAEHLGMKAETAAKLQDYFLGRAPGT